jgi:hypothetical protein
VRRAAWALAVVVALGVGALAWLRWRGSDRGPGSTAAAVAQLSEERTRLRDTLRELLTASDVLDFSLAPPGNILVGVPTSFTKKFVAQLLTGLFSEVRLHLTNLKAHHEDDVKARVLFAQRMVGHFVLDVDIKDIRAVLRPGEPELQFGGDKIHIRLPVTVSEGRGNASVRFQWDGKGIAGAVCGDLDVSPDVSSDVAPATYIVEGDFLLSAEGDTVLGKPRFGEIVLRVTLLPGEKTWATLAAAVADVKEDKNGICGMALQKVDIKAIVQKIIDKGFAVKLPAKLFREIALPAAVEQSVTFKGHTVSLDARPLGLHVTESMLWYGVALGAQGVASDASAPKEPAR